MVKHTTELKESFGSTTSPTSKLVLHVVREQFESNPAKFQSRVLDELIATDTELAIQLPSLANELTEAVTSGRKDIKSALLDMGLIVHRVHKRQSLLNALSTISGRA